MDAGVEAHGRRTSRDRGPGHRGPPDTSTHDAPTERRLALGYLAPIDPPFAEGGEGSNHAR